MATVPKPTAVSQTAPAVNARSVAVSARTASVSNSPIEQIDIGSNVAFDAAAYDYQDQRSQSDLGREEGRRRRYFDPGFDRLFTANSQVFALMFEAGDEKNVRPYERQPSKSYAAPVSKIISTYETNAMVIRGQQPIRGTEFSFNL